MTSRPAVPWLTVLPLACVLAFADGFWTISLRTVVGEISRAQDPFNSWLRESVLAVPVFVVAVLGALTLALSRLRSDVRRVRVVVTASLVVAAGTLAGVGWLTASAAYDYRLQIQQVEMMGSMGARCTGLCLARQEEATLLLQLKSVAFGSLILLLTNAVVVAWVVAMCGGRLELTSAHRRARAGLPEVRTRADGLRFVLVAGLLGSAVVGAGMAVAGQPGLGILAMGLSAAQTAVALRLVARATRTGLVSAIVVALGMLAVSAYLRIPGAVVTPHAGSPGLGVMTRGIASVLGLGTLAAAVVLLRSRRWLQRPPPSAHQASLALVTVLALTMLGLAGTGLV